MGPLDMALAGKHSGFRREHSGFRREGNHWEGGAAVAMVLWSKFNLHLQLVGIILWFSELDNFFYVSRQHKSSPFAISWNHLHVSLPNSLTMILEGNVLSLLFI
ncbi:uncharacterized protein DS421_2g53460 [Arachis hypogaea]|nr:uncharacterized protein DS421_2g53460 [Arachis hypogaea]